MEIVNDQGDDILVTANVCLIGPPGEAWEQVGVKFLMALKEAEENLTDLLPEGYRVVIKEWDSE